MIVFTVIGMMVVGGLALMLAGYYLNPGRRRYMSHQRALKKLQKQESRIAHEYSLQLIKQATQAANRIKEG